MTKKMPAELNLRANFGGREASLYELKGIVKAGFCACFSISCISSFNRPFVLEWSIKLNAIVILSLVNTISRTNVLMILFLISMSSKSPHITLFKYFSIISCVRYVYDRCFSCSISKSSWDFLHKQYSYLLFQTQIHWYR